MMTLPEKYFQFGDITLPGLEEKITLPKCTWFRYDGEVKESFSRRIAATEFVIESNLMQYRNFFEKLINQTIDNVRINYLTHEIRAKLPGIDNHDSYCYRHLVQREPAYVIAKKTGLSPTKTIFADGYQSANLLIHLKKLAVLEDLLKHLGVSLDISKLSSEDLADLGGLLAIVKNRDALNQPGTTMSPPFFLNRQPINPDLIKMVGLDA